MKPLLLEMTLRLFKGPRESDSRPIFGSILGIALSMIPLVVVIFLSDGMIKGITDRYIETGTFHIQLRPYEDFSQDEWDRTLQDLKASDQIIHAEREHSGMGLAFNGDLQTAVSIRSVNPSLYSTDKGFEKYMKLLEGEFSLESDSSIVVGKETAAQLNLSVGDELKIMTGKTLSTGKYIPKISTFTVRGIFTTGYQDLDKLWVFIPLDKGLRILQDSESGSRILLKVAYPYKDLNSVVRTVRSVIGGSRWGIYSWMTLNRSQQSNYETTKMVLILIMSLIVLIAVMNISSSMIMLVMENEQDIGIQKSMGLNNRFLKRQYIMTAALAGGTGSLIGLTAGALIAVQFNNLIALADRIVNGFISLYTRIFHIASTGPVSLLNSEYYLDDFSIELNFYILGLILILTFLLSAAAALIPVRNIGRITPLDILRKH